MIVHLTGCLALLLGGIVTPEAQDSAYNVRARRLLEVAAAESDTSFFTAAARIRLGVELPKAYAMLDSLTRDRTIGGMFYAYELIGTYLHCRTALPDSLHKKIREAFRRRTMYRGDTENHWVMYYTGLYLAAQTWPGESGSRWFNGRSSEENLREGSEWLREWMTITATRGQGEFDSPTYFTVFIGPMLILHEFAEDPDMKARAGMMVDLLFADFGAEHLRGNYGGGHSRDYPDDMINPLSAPTTMWAWLFFGEPEFEPWTEVRYRPRHRGSWEAAIGALGSYRLPPVVYSIATDRATPYVHTETKRVRNIIRFGAVRNPPVYKYTYVTPDFILGSLQGGILQPIQQHTWDLTFVSKKPNNTIFTLHPFVSARELAMFFPEEQQFLAGEVDRYHEVYTSPDKWNSSSPYEKVYQHEGSLIVLYNIPPGVVHQHTDGFFPKSLDDRLVDSSGWVFCRSGKTMVGVFPCSRGVWTEEAVNYRLRTPAGKSGFVVEAAGETDASSFAEFQSSLRKRKPLIRLGEGGPAVRFVTAGGGIMEFAWNGSRLLDGKPHSLTEYGLFRGPFVNGDTGVVTLTARGIRKVLDFRRGEVAGRAESAMPDPPAEGPRLYAAVYLSRGSVAGSNKGSYGAFVRNGLDTGWSQLNLSNVICFGLGYSGHGPRGRLYLAGGNGVHRSTDRGMTWKVLTGWRTEEILSIVPDPRDSSVLYAATPFGVFKTSDDGFTWSKRNRGLRKWYVHRLRLDRGDRKTLFALAEDDIYRSSDAGEHWIPLGTGITLPVALAQHPLDMRLFFAGGEEGGLRRSTDGGATWIQVREFSGNSVYAIRCSPDGKEVYAGGFDTGLWRSPVRGGTWERLPFAVECEAITAIYVDPADGNHVVVGTHGTGVYESTDHGARWKFAGLRGAMVNQIELYP